MERRFPFRRAKERRQKNVGAGRSTMNRTTTGFVLYDLEKSETDLNHDDGKSLEGAETQAKGNQVSPSKENESNSVLDPISMSFVDGFYSMLTYAGGTNTTSDNDGTEDTETSPTEDENPDDKAMNGFENGKTAFRNHKSPVVVLKSVGRRRKVTAQTEDPSKRKPVLGFLRALRKKNSNRERNATNDHAAREFSPTSSRPAVTNALKPRKRTNAPEESKRDNVEKIAPVVEKSVVAPYIPNETESDIQSERGSPDCVKWILCNIQCLQIHTCCMGGQDSVNDEAKEEDTEKQVPTVGADLPQKERTEVCVNEEGSNETQKASTPIFKATVDLDEDYFVKSELENERSVVPVATGVNKERQTPDDRFVQTVDQKRPIPETESDDHVQVESAVSHAMSNDSSKMMSQDFLPDERADVGMSKDSGGVFSFDSANSSVVFQEHTCFQPIIPSSPREARLYGVKGRPRLARKKSIVRKTPTFDETFSNDQFQYSVFVVNNQVADSSNRDPPSQQKIRDPSATKAKKHSKREVKKNPLHSSTSNAVRPTAASKRQEEGVLDDSDEESIAAASYDKFSRRDPLEFGSLESVSSADMSDVSSAAFAENEMNLAVEPMCMIYDP